MMSSAMRPLISCLAITLAVLLLSPAAQACYHDSTVREQEQEFESGYDPVVEPPLEVEEEDEYVPEAIAYQSKQVVEVDSPEVQMAGLGGLGLGVVLLGNMAFFIRRRL